MSEPLVTCIMNLLLDPPDKDEMKAAAVREIERENAEYRAKVERQRAKADAERREILDRQTVCFRAAFDESATKLAEEIGIEPGQVAVVLASIVAGQVLNFRCTFDDEL